MPYVPHLGCWPRIATKRRRAKRLSQVQHKQSALREVVNDDPLSLCCHLAGTVTAAQPPLCRERPGRKDYKMSHYACELRARIRRRPSTRNAVAAYEPRSRNQDQRNNGSRHCNGVRLPRYRDYWPSYSTLPRTSIPGDCASSTRPHTAAKAQQAVIDNYEPRAEALIDGVRPAI